MTAEVSATRPAARRNRAGFDRWLFEITVLLLLLGTVIVLDASSPRALKAGDELLFFKRQAVWVLLSGAVLLVGMHFPYWRFRDWRIWLLGLLAACLLLVAVLVPGIGIEVNGSRRWLGIGQLRFQPSEFAKLALIIFLARYSDLCRGHITNFWKGLMPAIVVIGVVGGLVAKEDLGTALVVLGTGFLMVFMMGARPRHLLALLLGGLAAGGLLVLVEEYRVQRVHAWWDLVWNPLGIHQGASYQPAQGLIAVGSGGVWGKGIGLGTAKHLYLPAEHTDYIFATVGEETGLIGCLFLIAAFAWLVIRGLNVAHRTRDWFGSLLAAGLTAMIGLQVLLNLAVVTGLVPCTGVPLPFISYGGSSVLFTTFAVAIILNISQHPDGAAAAGRRGREATGGGRRSWAEEEGEHARRTDGWRHRRTRLSGP